VPQKKKTKKQKTLAENTGWQWLTPVILATLETEIGRIGL
jgi:hypothetical protein